MKTNRHLKAEMIVLQSEVETTPSVLTVTNEMSATLVKSQAKTIRDLIKRNDLVLEPLTDLELVNDFWDYDSEVMIYNLEMASLDDYNINE